MHNVYIYINVYMYNVYKNFFTKISMLKNFFLE